jgi:hypothetical protein
MAQERKHFKRGTDECMKIKKVSNIFNSTNHQTLKMTKEKSSQINLEKQQ